MLVHGQVLTLEGWSLFRVKKIMVSHFYLGITLKLSPPLCHGIYVEEYQGEMLA